ncbi:hypothetical protein PCANC_20609 [Puccinia coronata f. sp. avenae]|uniref:Uncharacterized protein n=1 Tax=Puccinia coronata f. sp. avenae TaxID=200324 RepID=A0A2N5T4T7_9BASI|nr:hypothetical protein PCANC_20609 [Puccinia coronata f. sp. avenae]
MSLAAVSHVQFLKFNPWTQGITKSEILAKLKLLGLAKGTSKLNLQGLQDLIDPYCDYPADHSVNDNSVSTSHSQERGDIETHSPQASSELSDVEEDKSQDQIPALASQPVASPTQPAVGSRHPAARNCPALSTSQPVAGPSQPTVNQRQPVDYPTTSPRGKLRMKIMIPPANPTYSTETESMDGPSQLVAGPSQSVTGSGLRVPVQSMPLRSVPGPSQPATGPTQPAVGSKHLVACLSRRTSQPVQPVAGSRSSQPVTRPRQPVAEPSRLVAVDTLPVADIGFSVLQPVTGPAHLVGGSGHPFASLSQPARTTSQPIKKARGQIDPPGGLDQPINAPAQSAAPSQPVAGSSQLVSNPSQPVSVPSWPVFGTILSKPVEPITIQLQRPATNAVNINHLINTRRVFIPPTVKQTTESTPQDEGLTERVPEDTTPQDPKCSARQTTPCWPRRIRLISPLVSPLGSPNKPLLITFKCDWLEKIAEPDRERMSLIKAICAKPFKLENLEGKKGREITNAQTTTYIPDNLKNLLLEIQEGWIQTDTTADCGVEERGGTQVSTLETVYQLDQEELDFFSKLNSRSLPRQEQMCSSPPALLMDIELGKALLRKDKWPTQFIQHLITTSCL